MTDTTLPRCSRTGGIVEGILDGNEAAVDRVHLASCATCSREVDGATQFVRSLSATASEAAEGIPDPALLDGERRRLSGGRTGRLTLRILTLAGAVAAGLVIATVIGSRALAPTGRGPSIFGPSVAAQQRLEAMDLACGHKDGPIECMSIARDHMHDVLLTLDAQGQIASVEARVDSTNGKPLDPTGANVMFARVAAAVLAPEVRSPAVNWITDTFAACESKCAGNLDDVRMELTRDPDSVHLKILAR